MVIVRLILLALVLFLVGFGVYPAMEYGNVGAIAMLGAAGVLIVVIVLLRPIRAIFRTALGKILGLLVFLCVGYLVAVEVIMYMKGRPVEPLPEADVVVVLGAGLTYGTEDPSLVLAYRLQEVLKYLEKYPDTPVIVSGGQGEIEKISEALAMKRYLVKAGVDEGQILMESRSSTTAENLKYSAEIAEENDFEKVAVVSSDYHCLRVGMLAEDIGLDATCVPAENVWWLAPADRTRECMAVTKTLVDRVF